MTATVVMTSAALIKKKAHRQWPLSQNSSIKTEVRKSEEVGRKNGEMRAHRNGCFLKTLKDSEEPKSGKLRTR